MNLRKWILPLLLVLLMLPSFTLQGVSAREFTDINDFLTYFNVRPLSSSAAISYSTPVFNTTAEYFEFYLNMTRATDGTGVVEITIPDCYMGLSVWEWNGTTWVLKDGTSGWALSVPYFWNTSGTPLYDWGSSGLIAGSGQYGVEKRVQLAVPLTANVQKQLKVRVYYATSPSIGFDGVNDYIHVPNAASLNPTDEITVGVWSKLLEYPIEWWLPITKGGGGGVGYRIGFNSDNKKIYFESYTSTSIYIYADTFGIIPINTWLHMIGTYKNEELAITINITRNTRNKTGILDTGMTNVLIGSGITNNRGKCLISEARIYGRALSTDEILALYNKQEVNNSDLRLLINASSFSSNPTNTTVVDFSSNNNHGTAYGNVQYKVYTGSGFKFTIPNRAPNAPTPADPAPWWRFNPGATISFLWYFNDPDEWDMQGAYQLQLGNNDFSTIYVDTGKVSGEDYYADIALPINMTVGLYYWRLKTWDNYDAEGPWSYPQALVIDKVKVESITTDKLLRNLGSIATINVTLRYAWDSDIVESGTFVLNGIPMAYINNGIWQALDIQGYIHNKTYNNISGVEGIYGLTTFDMNGQSLTIEWGRNIIYNNTATEFSQLIGFDIFNGIIGLFQFTLGDLFFATALLGIMFLSAIRFQSLSIPALLGVICYAVFFNFMANTSRLVIGVSLALFVAYTIYQAYTHED